MSLSWFYVLKKTYSAKIIQSNSNNREKAQEDQSCTMQMITFIQLKYRSLSLQRVKHYQLKQKIQ